MPPSPLILGSGLPRWIGRSLVLACAGLAGAGVAMLAGLAIGKSFTLHEASGTIISAGKSVSAKLAVNTKGRAVYELKGESRHHLLCTATNGCFGAWLPVTVPGKSKPSAAPGIKGKLSVILRHNNGHKLRQLVLAGHPLYTFVGDTKRAVANGNGFATFGGVWHVVLGTGAAASRHPSSTGTTPTDTTTTPTYTYTTPTYTYTTPTYTYTYPTS